MEQQKFYTPLKVGLLIVVISYFLFTLHAMFTLSWLGEWIAWEESLWHMILVEDISATIGLVFRFAASILALATIGVYFSKKDISKPTAYKVARLVLVFEGIYWLGLIAMSGYSVQFFSQLLSHNRSLDTLLYNLMAGVIPAVVEAIVLPIILFFFAFNLNHNKPLKTGVKWGLITGTLYIVVFWLTNTSSWLGVVRSKGIQYLWVDATKVMV